MSGEHPATILIVEDDASLVRLYSALFRTEGYCVRVSRNGVDGLTALAEKRPDAIILDLSMPVMDGRTFYGLCREQGFDGPVIISSAFGCSSRSA